MEVIKCRECGREAKYVLTNKPMSIHPFVCGIHKRVYLRREINLMGFVQSVRIGD